MMVWQIMDVRRFALKIDHAIEGDVTFLGLSWKHLGRFTARIVDPPQFENNDTATEDVWVSKTEEGEHKLTFLIQTAWLHHASVTRYSWVYHSPVLKRDYVWSGIDLPESFPLKEFLR
jgi:hypothetical protein